MSTEVQDLGLIDRIKRAWRELGKGPRRALLAGWVLAFIVGVTIVDNQAYSSRNEELPFILLGVYWPLVLIGLWIYRGFKK